jgi:ATP-dependent DNA helicase DinG
LLIILRDDLKPAKLLLCRLLHLLPFRKVIVSKSKKRSGHLSVETFFGPNGPLADALPGYEARQEQIQVSRTIDDAMERGAICIAEAGTGVGKTMAYLVPAVQNALHKKQRTVITTHTISLQNQLVTKDLPLVLSLIPEAEEKVTFELMKGRGNYLCPAALDFVRTDIFVSQDPLFHKLLKWFNAPTCSGDLADLPYSYPNWSEVTSTPEMCGGANCSYYNNCPYYCMRRTAADADILVVNHALFFADLCIKMENPEAGFLPAYDCVVFDEAHHLEDVATAAFGVEFSSRKLTHLIDRIKKLKDVEISRERLDGITDVNARLFSPFTRVGRMEFTFEEALSGDNATDAETACAEAINSLIELQKELLEQGKEHEELKERLEGYARTCSSARMELEALFINDHSNSIRWAEAAPMRPGGRPSDQRFSLRLTPVDVAGSLEAALWEPLAISKGSAILISATLANSGGFSYLKSRLGLPNTVQETLVGSPFDFKSNAILYVPAHLPEPAPGKEYLSLLSEEIEKIVKLTSGRAFLLFTSRTALNTVYDLLSERLDLPLFKQGEMPPGALVREFKESENGCLFGLQTFWEGIDVQGDALSCVIIDRLPFAVPDSPITRARTKAIQDRGGDWFFEYSVPQAQIRLKQGFGRLIRTRKDSGIVAILDTRMLTRGYGSEFVKYLPPTARASKWNRLVSLYASLPCASTAPAMREVEAGTTDTDTEAAAEHVPESQVSMELD